MENNRIKTFKKQRSYIFVVSKTTIIKTVLFGSVILGGENYTNLEKILKQQYQTWNYTVIFTLDYRNTN
jgi:hypothetical protein